MMVNNLLIKDSGDGATAYFSNLPVKRMTEAMKAQGVPASLSHSAGTFVCNHILYQLGYLHEQKFPNIKFGFIHVPFIPEQVVHKANHHPCHSTQL